MALIGSRISGRTHRRRADAGKPSTTNGERPNIIIMMTLYHNDMSVCAAKVRTALAEKKLSGEGVHLDLRAGEAKTRIFDAQCKRGCANPRARRPNDHRVTVTVNISTTNGQIYRSSPIKLGALKCVFGRSNWTKAFTPRLRYFPFVLPFVISGWRGRRKIGRNGWLVFRNQIPRATNQLSSLD